MAHASTLELGVVVLAEGDHRVLGMLVIADILGSDLDRAVARIEAGLVRLPLRLVLTLGRKVRMVVRNIAIDVLAFPVG